MAVTRPAVAPPGTEETRRFRPRLRYELVACATSGHELLGTDVARLRPEDQLVARDEGPVRWHRCLRCDSWLPLPPPANPVRETMPPLHDIEVPLRGRPLRDRYVLRLISLDRAVHFLVLSALAAAIFVFATHHKSLDNFFALVLRDIQGASGGPVHSSSTGITHELRVVMNVSTSNLDLVGAAVSAYAVLEGVEAVGLWLGKRWAEYLTFLATVVFVPYEVYELVRSVSALKAVTFVINVAIVVYLLLAKRLFGLRGGGRAEERRHEQDTGWPAVERATWWLDPAPKG